MRRREYLLVCGGISASAISGCTGDGGNGGNDGSSDDDTEEDADDSEPAYDISINLPVEAAVGEEVTLSWTIENTGDATGEGDVRVWAEIEGEDEVIEERTVAVAPGERIEGSETSTLDIIGDVSVFVEGPDGSTGSSTITIVDGVDEEAAASHIQASRGELMAAYEQLQAAMHEDDVDLDEQAFSDALDGATAELEAAGRVATDAQLETIGALQDYTEYLSLFGEVHLTGEEGFGVHLLAGLDEYWGAREQYFQDDVGIDDVEAAVDLFEQSAASYEEAHDTFGAARETAEEAESLLQTIPSEVIDEFADISHAESTAQIESQIYVLSEMELFAAGVHHGSRAWAAVSNAFISFEREDWATAESDLEVARDAFSEMENLLQEFDFEQLEFILIFFEETLCELGNGTAAVEHWMDAAEAAKAGDGETHAEEMDAGWALMTECHEE